MKTKIKPDGDETTDFHNRKMPMAGSNHTYLAITTIDFSHKDNKIIILKLF